MFSMEVHLITVFADSVHAIQCILSEYVTKTLPLHILLIYIIFT